MYKEMKLSHDLSYQLLAVYLNIYLKFSGYMLHLREAESACRYLQRTKSK
jgi:hypothetical protein